MSFAKEISQTENSVHMVVKDAVAGHNVQDGALDADEWIFIEGHNVVSGQVCDVYARLKYGKASRIIGIYDIHDTLVLRLEISGGFNAAYLTEFDQACSIEAGVAGRPVCQVEFPASLPAGLYFIDKKWLFYIEGDVAKSDVVFVIPFTTMGCFCSSFGGSIYDVLKREVLAQAPQKPKRYGASMRRPMQKNFKHSMIAPEALCWLTEILRDWKLAFVDNNRLPEVKFQASTRLLLMLGRVEDWTRCARVSFGEILKTGPNVLTIASEVMYHEVEFNDHMCTRIMKWALQNSQKAVNNELRPLVGCNPFDGGLPANLSHGHPPDPPSAGFYQICSNSYIFQGTGLSIGDTVPLYITPYEGLPVKLYESGKPVLDLKDLAQWRKVTLLAHSWGENTREKHIGAFAEFESNSGSLYINMGSAAWISDACWSSGDKPELLSTIKKTIANCLTYLLPPRLNFMQRLLLMAHRPFFKMTLSSEHYTVFKKDPVDFIRRPHGFPCLPLRKRLKLFGPIPPSIKNEWHLEETLAPRKTPTYPKAPD